MTPVRTRGNFCGSRIDSATGRISPIPSKANTAVLQLPRNLELSQGSESRRKHRGQDGPDQKREILRVEQLDVRDAPLPEEGDLVRKYVDQTDDDKDVGDEGRAGQLLDVADQRKGYGVHGWVQSAQEGLEGV